MILLVIWFILGLALMPMFVRADRAPRLAPTLGVVLALLLNALDVDLEGVAARCMSQDARSKESLAHWGGNRPVPADAYAAQALRSSTTDLGYPGEPAEEDLCPYCRCLKPCPCEGDDP